MSPEPDGPSCRSCWFAEVQPFELPVSMDRTDVCERLVCRRYPPGGPPDMPDRLPEVDADADYCGEWTPIGSQEDEDAQPTE